MTNPELYIPVKTRKVIAHTHEQIQGIPAIIPGLNAEDLKEFSLIAQEDANGGNQNKPGSLIKISQSHGRSYEARLDGLENIIWQDQYGNSFSSLTLKGNNLTSPRIFEQDNAPSGYAYFGLQDSDSIKRILKVSDLLRKNHIDTEMIVGVLEPLKLPYEGKDITLNALKRKLVQNFWEQSQQLNSTQDQSSVLNELTAVSKALNETTFLITLRAMAVPERLDDLKFCSSEEDLVTIMKRAFLFVNNLQRKMAKESPGNTPVFFNINEPQSIFRYLTDYLPKKAAANFARLHNLGLVHSYPHAGNITITGALVDLDSVKGHATECGDSLVTEEMMSKEVTDFLNEALDVISPLIQKFPNLGSFKFENKRLERLVFKRNFIGEYVSGRGWKNDIANHIEAIFSLHEGFDSYLDQETLKEYLLKLSAQTGFEYDYTPNPGFISTIYYQEQQEIWHDKIDHALGALTVEEYQEKQDLRTETDNPAIPFSPKLSLILQNSILEDINIQKALELSQFKQSYGPLAADKITIMFAIREMWKAKYLLPVDTNHQKKTDYYRKFISDIGWEENIIPNIINIYNIFNEFDFTQDYETFKYYRGLLTKQLGFDFRISEPVDEILEKFYRHDLAKARSILDSEITQSEPNKTVEDIFQKAFSRDEWDKFPQDRFNDFVIEMASNKIQEMYQIQLSDIPTEYGQDIANTVEYMLTKHEVDRILDSRGYEDEMNETVALNMTELKKSYANVLSPAL